MVPSKILSQKSSPVCKSDDIKGLIKNLRESISRFGFKGFGTLSAVQIGVLKRLFVIKRGNMDIVVINPIIIKEYGGKSKSWEICFSIPGKVGNIKRNRKGDFEYYDEEFTLKKVELSRSMARIFYHEIDHLNGITYLDRIENVRRDLMDEKNYWNMRKKL